MMNTIVSSIQPYIAGVLLAIAALPARGQAARPPDDNQLKTYLMGEFISFEGYDRAITHRLKDGGVTDEQLRRVLASIYAESEAAFAQARDQYARMTSSLRRANAIRELGNCADDGTQTFLLDVTAERSKDGVLRTIALSSYLRNADAEEAKDALIRFLVGEERMDDMMRLSLYQYAQMAWHEADSMEKKAAILAALYVALSAESPPWVFRVGDQIVREMSPRYANSKERLVLLERALAQPFPERRERTKRELASRLEEMRKLTILTTINTNLAVLQARDFNQPLSEEQLADLTIPPPVAPVADEPAQDKPQRPTRTGRYVIGGAALLALAAAVVWVLSRRSHV